MHSEESPPNLFESWPVSVWREVYQGRWSKLRTVQQVEFVVEVLFLSIFCGAMAYGAYVRPGNMMGLALAFVTVGAVLGTFFFLLARSIR
jgi:hypothetical protein